ncbi:MAG TPA: hypothetical protein DCL66_15140 [Gammaproteobacteria bacterium]|nr:hypothetical protein [Gammaproteobacteria bacterium]
MSVLVEKINVFAKKYGVPPNVAMMLPAIFKNAAGKVDMDVEDLVDVATEKNAELALYLITIADKCANSKVGMERWNDFINNKGEAA